MRNHYQEHIETDRMSAEDIQLILSQTMKDLEDKKVTLRYAQAVSRVAVALSKIIETVDLKKRIEFIEQSLKKRK